MPYMRENLPKSFIHFYFILNNFQANMTNQPGMFDQGSPFYVWVPFILCNFYLTKNPGMSRRDNIGSLITWDSKAQRGFISLYSKI